MARRAFYPTREVQPAQVEVWQRATGEPPAAARLVGRYAPGQAGSFAYNPLEDRDIILSTITIAADGTRSVRELADATEETLTFQRETAAPVIGQVGDATMDQVTVGISATKLTRKRRIRIADALTGGGDLDSPVETIVDYGNDPVPSFIDIARSEIFTPTFTLAGGVDPASNGFSKTGSGATEENAGGWRINTLTTDAATYYTKTSWPGSAFAAGFTIELSPPAVADTDNANPSEAACLRIEDGTHRYELMFDADEVKLNGGASHAHGNAKVRLVVAAGGATADLWIGDTLTEDNTAYQSTATSGLKFGDLATTDDADAVWSGFSYVLAAVAVRLAQTIYVAVAQSSGGDYTPDSNILTVTFANEGSGAGGTVGVFDPIPREKIDYDTM